MLLHAPDDVRAEPISDLGWTRDPNVREGIRPVLADRGYTAQFLGSRGITLTNHARTLFLDCVLDNFIAAMSLLERRADGDYAADEIPAQFSKFSPLVARKDAKAHSPWALFEGWVKSRQPAQSTVNRWGVVFENLEAKFSSDNAQPMTEDVVQEWSRELITAKRSPRTVRDIWVNAANTVHAWAKRERLIDSNPFEDVHVTVPRKRKHREMDAFTADEARTILRAASSLEKTDSAFAAAKRWVPWLCAYSGARVGEITQLRGGDIERRGEFHAMRLTPDAGTMKTDPRTVPLHEHIIAQGFLEFVKSRGKGPLFYETKSASKAKDADDPMKPKRPRSVKARHRLAQWVRDIGVNDPEVQPNHAWRDTFKQIAERHDISERVHDTITGHAPKSVGRTYGKATPEDMAEALKKFPRYHV